MPESTAQNIPKEENRQGVAISTVVSHEDDIDKKMASQQAFKALLENGRLLLSLVIDYVRGNYREVPHWVIGSAAFALIYVLSPIDLIPDVIPVIGYLDDAVVLGFCLKLVDTELNKYKEWKEKQQAKK